MTTSERTEQELIAEIIAKVQAGGAPPWRTRAALEMGLPTSGSTKKVYGGATPFVLWQASLDAGHRRSIWFTENAAIRKRGTVRGEAPAVVVRGHRVFNIDDIDGISAPAGGFPAADVARRRVLRLVRFVQARLLQGDTAEYKASKDAIILPPAANFKNPDDYCTSALRALVHWTGGNNRLARKAAGMPAHPNFATEAMVAELTLGMVCSWLGLHGSVGDEAERQALWLPKLISDDKFLGSCANEAARALEYIQDLSPSDLLVDKKPQKRRGRATALGEVLEIPFDEVGKGYEADEQLVLTLPEKPGASLLRFLTDFGGAAARRKPEPYAFLWGAKGTGAPQVTAAISELLLTGGTDLDGSLLQTQNDDGALLDAIASIWENETLHVVPCELPDPDSVPPDRALPTACLSAFHVQAGLSPVMWVARLEHVLERSGEYDAFAETFHAFAGRRWRGGANRDPEGAVEQIIEALGGDAEDDEDEDTKRVRWYQKTRSNATWAALQEEVDEYIARHATEWSQKNSQPYPEDPPPRVLFVIDMGPGLRPGDGAAKKWVRRVLKDLNSRLDELQSGGQSPAWFLLCADRPPKQLYDLGDWGEDERKVVKTQVALDKHPVIGAFKTRLLAKIPDQCAPLYRMYADNKSLFSELSQIVDWPAPITGDREDVVDSFPFLPCVLPVAQAVLDTLATDEDNDHEVMPLSDLVEKAIDDQYYGPLDRFISLDQLFEPMGELFEVQEASTGRQAPSASVAAARPAAAAVIIMPTAAAVPAARAGQSATLFSTESVLKCLRLANRVEGFPCTARNLVPLVFQKVEEDMDLMVDELKDQLADLKERGFVSTDDDEHYTFEKMR